MSLFSSMSADTSADASADTLCIIIHGKPCIEEVVGEFTALSNIYLRALEIFKFCAQRIFSTQKLLC